MENIRTPSDQRAKRVIYLAGGLRSGWQERVKSEVPCCVFIDPRDCSSADPTVYTPWDLDAINRSDVLLAYFEIDNPTGYALALEVGYAKALNKLVILVDEKSVVFPNFARALAMVRAAADETFNSLQDGLTYLRALANPQHHEDGQC